WYHCVVKHPDFKTQKRTGGWVQDSILAYGLRIMVTICDASPNDSLALVNFHNSLKVGPGWDLSKPVKTWKGVKFECAHVQEINLSGEGLIGVVSGLNRLKYLEKLDLSNNALDSISFPLSSFNLDVMRSIDLSNNRIRDSKYQRFYPYTKAIMLDTLKLRGNFFTGFFSFVNFTPTHLDLKGNRITGFEMIYDPWAGTERRAKPNHNEGDKAAQRRAAGVFSNFKTKYLDVSGNDLTADAFYVDSLNMIKHLDLSRNRFASTFPNLEEFSDSLQYLNLSYNQFSGTLPSLSSLRKLDTLIVSHNGFGGSVNTINLWKTPGKPISHLDLGNNNFFGAVSDSFSLLSRLQYLALDSNAAFNDERLLVKIQSLPVVPPMGLRQLHVENNQLHFGHLKNYAALGKGLKWYPQDSLDVRSPSRNFAQDSSYVYDAAIANNEDAAQIYQWYRIKLDGTREKLNASAKLLLNDLQKTDIGTYFASVKHSSLSTDSLITKKFFVNVTYCRLNIKDSLAMLHFYKNAKMAMPVTFDPKRAGTWPGIKLECEYITEIRLPNRSLSGTLTGLDSLLYLEVLDLSGNSLKSTTLKLDTIINKLRVVKLTNNGLKLYNPYMSFPTKSTEAADTMDLSGNSLKSFYSYGVLPKYLNLSKDSLSYLYMSSPFGQPHTLQHFDASHNLISNVILTNGMNG
ncbi:MAG TPA: hypothetical protein VL947_12170, partial [Cytophagales bacterium]|nr:hypothetical protein [Cytophagales bacterium]